MAKKGNFYSIIPSMSAGASVVELRIYDDIGFWGKTAAQFVDELDAVAASATKIIVSINSGGGSVYDAFAMYNALRRYSGKTVGRVDGVAASAATLPLIACDTIEMPDNAQIMIHEPTTVAWGTVAELKSSVAQMENIIDSVIAAYVRRSGQSAEKIAEMMEATTWMSALDAQALGFCDVIEEPVELAMSSNTRELLSRFDGVPESLRMLVELDDVPAVDPAPEPEPEPEPEPTPSNEATSTELASYVYVMCRAQGISDLAEGILMSGALEGRSVADLRIAEAKEIAGMCLAARLPEKAADYVSASLSADQVRARLFDQICNDDQDPISNRAPSVQQAPRGPALSISAVYAARAATRRLP